MKAGKVIWSGVVLAAAWASAGVSAWASPLSLSLGPDSLEVSGLAPGGGAAILGVSRVGIESLVRTERFEGIVWDGDGDGSVTVELPGAVSDRSAWIAVDLSTGEWSVAYPEGYPAVPPPAVPASAGAAGFD